MLYRESQASRSLAGHIKAFWSLEYDSSGVASQPETVLPDGCPEIVFNLSDRFKRLESGFEETQPATIFVGQMSRCISICPTGRVSLFGVRFHPAGAFPVGGGSMHELTNNIIDVGQFLGPPGRDLEELIAESSSFEERIGIFENYLCGRLAVLPTEDRVTTVAAGMIVRSGGTISVARLTDEIGISERRLERKFRKRVGISPKMLARTVRFQNVVRKLQSVKSSEMLDAALSLGYFDQSHMIREFKEFSGETPLAFLKRTHDISDIFTAAAA